MNLKQSLRRQLERYWDKAYEKRRKGYLLDYMSWILYLDKTVDDPEAEKERFRMLQEKDTGQSILWVESYFARYLKSHPEKLLVYADEDMLDRELIGYVPWLKPDWSPDAYLCRDYLGGAVAVRQELYDRLCAQLTEEQRKDIGLCHDLLVEWAGGYEPGCDTIGHLKDIMFTRKEAWDLPGEGRTGRMRGNEIPGETSSLVSVIIPSKDNPEVLFRCLDTLVQTVTEIPYEILLVDNGSNPENRKRIQEKIEQISHVSEASLCRRAKYLYQPMEFNFSRMCNLGASEAQGDLYLFLNDDIQAVEKGWMEVMAHKASEPWAGAVGIKLLYPDGKRIQHAGVVDLLIGPVHKLQYLEDDQCYYDGRNRGIWNAIAVTGACMMLRKEIYEAAGGFSEELRVAFNDIDLCFTIHEMGYHNVQINDRYLLHHESLSRGNDDTEEKQRRLVWERDLLYARHPKRRGDDPYYHIYLNNRRLDSRIRPAYMEGRSEISVRTLRKCSPQSGHLQKAREDACLRLTIEYAGTEWIQGYLVVLGSDNALFERRLLFRLKERPEVCYEMKCGEQYRIDLEENMPDQRNVGLCGFWCRFRTPLPEGEYQIGAWARDRISGQKLISWSHCTLQSYGEGMEALEKRRAEAQKAGKRNGL